MTDLETFGTSPDSVISTLGVVKFDPFTKVIIDSRYYRLDVDDQLNRGRATDDSTLEWWGKQNPEVLEEVLGEEGRTPVAQVIEEYHKFVWNSKFFWSHGANFDMVLMESLYKTYVKPLSWQYHQVRCSRTLFGLVGNPVLPDVGGGKHNALTDAIRQAHGVQNAVRTLGLSDIR